MDLLATEKLLIDNIVKFEKGRPHARKDFMASVKRVAA
jgi:hypothetical protein